MGGSFYLQQALFPNFQAMRSGASYILECMDASMDNTNFKVVEKESTELYSHYPMKFHELYLLNAGTVVTFITSLWRQFLPERITNKFQLGARVEGLEGGRKINELYCVPTEEDARKRMLVKVLKNLILRYENQVNFSLDKAVLMEPN